MRKKINNNMDIKIQYKLQNKIKSKIILLVVILSMLGILAGCSLKSGNEGEKELNGQQEIITVTHTLGSTEVNANPQKIVVLDWAILDIIDSLNLGDKVVGIPKSSNAVSYLEKYAKEASISNVGTVKEADMEAIYALEPDLILIGGRMTDYYEELSKIAPTIQFSISYEMDYLDSLKQNVSQIASMWGKTDEAELLFKDFDQRIEILENQLTEKKSVISMVSNSSITVLGTNGRCSLINSLGINNISNSTATHGDSVSFEYLLEKNPEYIFVLDRDSAIGSESSDSAKEIIENALVKKTDAYKKGNIVYLSPTAWYLAEGGIQSTDTMLQDLENAVIK